MIEIDLARGHEVDACRSLAGPLYAQLTDGYTRGVSTMPLAGTFEQYLEAHRTTRKRAARAARLGYIFEEITRSEHADDVFEINTSAPERQGRPMAAAYHERPYYGDEPKLCDVHHVYTYGVLGWIDGVGEWLAAYLWLYRCGDLAMISSILGHAEALRDDVMYLLVSEAIREQLPLGGTLFYNRHVSGTDGLRYFKERLGLQPTEVRWKL